MVVFSIGCSTLGFYPEGPHSMPGRLFGNAASVYAANIEVSRRIIGHAND